ncbi:LANO_0F04236g1_1 [Lachancea nothofagi CBS 11611]|uniref:LANO_0F04236g1_1 n=1 Tax=Lachancea nothofagi CBS 11611 TaxID=1266666 RepID=A0A1G4K7H8_9SACH|nr:LANO_0F04236g1_1 [Lachancea nothofagi CBS 11611]
MSELSASEYIKEQNALEDEARELMPQSPTHCTYVDGALRQPVFACLDCGEIGVCYSCSIQCHANCDLVELFTKRGFTCDCGTERQLKKKDKSEFWCQLRQNSSRDIPSSSNTYGQNFKGRFCDCHKRYDHESDSTMIQCALGLNCNEDWYHCSCILETREDTTREANTSEPIDQLPKDFPSLESFDAFLCWKCVSRFSSIFQDLLAHTLSQKLIAHIVPHSNTLESAPSSSNAVKAEESSKKRRAETDDDLPFSIMFRPDYKDVLVMIKDDLEESSKLYVFLQDIAPFLLDEDSVYEPSEDSDDATSTFELGTQALSSSVDRSIAVAGIQAMDNIKQKLSEFLKPFADSGKIVKEEDIRNFFKLQKEEESRDS